MIPRNYNYRSQRRMLEELNVRIDDSEMYIFPPTEEKDGKKERKESEAI